MRRFIVIAGLIYTPLALCLFGCTKGPSKSEVPKPVETVHAHDHDSHGPHGGDLIELGEDEFHAELVHDEKAGTVTVYILDGTAKAASPIETEELTINLKHDGRGEQFKLAASPDAGDPAGKSSRFASTDAELLKDLDAEDAAAQLALSINGKPYNAAIEHHHE